MCRLCSGPGIRFAGYPDRHSSQHFAEESRHLPRRPRSGPLPQSRRRDMTSADPSASLCRASPVFAMRTHPKRNATHLALGAPTAAPSSPTTAQHLSAFPISLPRQQRGEGHSRSCSTNITASQASWMLLHVVPGQPACLDSPSPNNLPPYDIPRPIGPRKECPAPKWRCVLASCGSSPHRYRASRLAAACRLRQSGRRDRGPFTLPRSGCPVCRSRHPAAFPGRPQSPPPTAPRGILRSRPAAIAAGLARKTPCHSLQST